MNKLLKQAVDRVRTLSSETQDEFARVLLRIAGDDEPVCQLAPEEEADLIEAEAELERGEFATEVEIETVFSKYRLGNSDIVRSCFDRSTPIFPT